MNIPFTFMELCITDEPISQDIANKLLHFHILPMSKVRHELGSWITASQNSGYRPKAYELMKGRSGNSQHTFEGSGAVDWTCKKSKLLQLFNLIIENTEYNRIAIYENFIHCDYGSNDGFRYIYESDSKSEWTLTKTIKLC